MFLATSSSTHPRSRMKERIDQRAVRTKELLVNAAEQLFAEKGLEGASMRDVTSLAQVNLAAANYHFGGKEGLYREVVSRQMVWVSEQRLALLEKARSEQSIELWVEAYFVPALERIRVHGEKGKMFIRLLSRTLFEDPTVSAPLIRDLFEPVNRKFAEALKEMIPELDETNLFWCMHFALSVLQNTLMHYSVLEDYAPNLFNEDRIEELRRRLVMSAVSIIRSYQDNPDQSMPPGYGE